MTIPFTPALQTDQLRDGALFSVRLIDRRTGRVPRLDGLPLTLLTPAPGPAVNALMHGRDRAIWRAEVVPLRFAALG